VRGVQCAARRVATGNLAATGALLSELENDTGVGTHIANELHRLVAVDLGLSLVETPACRQLVGIPI
jgi:hypothetical protein